MVESMIQTGAVIATVLPSVLSGVILAIISKQQKKADERAKDRVEREELTLEAINAMFCVTKELVDCVLYGKQPNGELKEAFEYKQQVKHKIEEYQRKKISKL